MKHLVRILLAIALLTLICGMASAEEIASGYLDSAGRWLKWTLDSEGTLTLDGQGATPNYSDTDRPPWFEYVDQVKRVEIKGSVTSLGSCLFKDHTALEEMPEIPEKLTWIGNYLFQGCTSLREVYYPWGDNNGGAWFADCTALEKVVFSGKATSIGIQSFDGCTALKEIEIPEKITKIGSAAFENCTALKEIDLPQNLAEIGTNAFYKSGLERVSFPESLKKIDTKAFADCQLRHVTLPIQATFGKNAFMNNPVAEIIIPEGVKALSQEMFAINVSSDAEGHVETIVLPSTLSEIPAAAFAGVKIDRMTIPGTVRDIGAQAFFSCGKAKVEEGVLTLGNYCFYDCKRLELPASVTTLGKNITCGVVFAPRGSAAYEYARYAINGAEAALATGEPAFSYIGWDSKTCGLHSYYGEDEVVNIPATIGGLKVVFVPEYLFEKAPQVKEAFMPAGEIQFDFALGQGTDEPVKVHLAKGNWSFININDEEGKKSTAHFYVDRNHEYVTNKWAFLGTNETLHPNHVLFGNIPTIVVEDWEDQPFVYKISGGQCTIIGYHGLDEVVRIPEKIGGYPVTGIGYRAFMGSVAKDVIIPNTVRTIGAEAFWMVKNPKELMVRMPASVTAFGSRAIPTNFGTEVLYIPGSAYANKFGEGRWWDGVDTVYDVFYYEEEGSGDIREMYEITGFYGYDDTAVLPAKCNGKPISRLGSYCFNGIRHYNTIIVPEGIVESEESFTRNCADHIYLPRSLEKLELDPSWLSNTTFHVYKDSAAHKYLTERGGFKIRIIYDVDLRLPESLTSIAAEAFDANEQIQFVEIDEKVLSVGDRAFRNCVNLHYAYFLGMNTKIGKDVFAGCEELSIVCLEGSSAEAYAKANGIKYIRPDEME